MVLALQTELLLRAFRVVMAYIDNVVYWAVMEIYSLIDQISRINVFSEGTISEFGERIYTIIGVLMLFKLAFSIISYIVDPDKLTDSKKGFSSIVKNIVIMLVLLVTVPLIFRYAMALQYVVVSDDTIGRLITGRQDVTHQGTGDYMAVAILSSFIYPDSGIEGYPEEGCMTHVPHEDGEPNECEKALSKYNLDGDYHRAFTEDRGYNGLISMAMSTAKMSDGNHVIVYRPILSTITGGFTAWVLLMFCIDIAVRIVKLGFLQLIAPIPIVTYMDDGGQGTFKKWVKACTTTYADLFIRLAAINFALFIITSVVVDNDGNGNFKMCTWSFADGTLSATCNDRPGLLVRLFLILGTLMFAKQLPKILKELGLELDGKFSINPMKKLTEVPIAGAALGAGLGAIDSKIHGGNWWEGARRGFGAVGIGGSSKTLKDLTPMRQDMLKKRTEGRNELSAMHRNYIRGDEALQRLNAATGGRGFDALDGRDHSAYKAAGYKNEEFIKSLMDLDNESARNKNFETALDIAHQMGPDFQSIEVNGKTYNDIGSLSEDYRKSNKIVKGLEDIHSSIRKEYTDDARLEDELKIRKNNSSDPTKPGTSSTSPVARPSGATRRSTASATTSTPSRTSATTSTATSAAASTTTSATSAGSNSLNNDPWNNTGSYDGSGWDGGI